VSKRDRKLLLFQALVGIRRAGRRDPDDRGLALARVLLEQDLGPTVSVRLAGEMIGVSHTALRRWIDRKDLPVVYAEAGRMQVPVAALLELYEEMEADRATGRGHPIEPLVLAARRNAERLPDDLLADIATEAQGHRAPQVRGLAYHRVLARRLTKRMIADARQVLADWELEGRIDPTYATAWRELLAKPAPELRRALAADTPEMADLRQNSPFAGMLSEPERRAALAAAAPQFP